uniref:Protein T05D4.3 n=2 Tax=Haemonchus contortus TaxID=6289 RepID=A0A7I4YDG8_HAECO
MPNEQNGYCGPSYQNGIVISTDNCDSMRYQRRPGEHLLNHAPYQGPIPRIRVKNLDKSATAIKPSIDQYDQYEDRSPTVRHKRSITRMDTFRENAIETKQKYVCHCYAQKLKWTFFSIYDEFRFLDETEAPSPVSSAHPIVNAVVSTDTTTCKRQLSPSLIAYCLLPLIQLTISIGLALLAIVRLRQLFDDPLSSNSLLDFNKPEGLLPIDERSSQTLKIRSAISVLIPATFQCIGAIAGFWPLAKQNRRSYQIIHITFCALAVLQWMPSVHAVAIEINQTFVQIHEWYHMSSYLIYIILLCAASFGAIVLPSITLSIAATQLIPYSRQLKSDVIGVCLALATALLAATVCCFSGYATSRSLTNVTQWKTSPALANQPSLYSFALREVIVATYALLASVFFFVAAVQRNYGLVIASAIIQIICLVALSQLLSPTRLTAVLVNSRVLAIDNSSYPVAQVNVVLLYAFIVTLLFVISVQFIVTVISLRSHSTTNTSTSHNIYPQQRTSF